ncbi:PAS domain S-box protein [Arenibaculum sp.]|uniref:PAS domain S-box protein n=1 Tax=Arenibaculum sp. TaxID=2865862 RepID=UPI002E11BD7D|nr:PAS domain S-box protein [Arenibaculum sp.]
MAAIIRSMIVAAVLALLPAGGGFAHPVVLDHEADSYPLGRALQVLDDPAGSLDLSEVTGEPWASRFEPAGTGARSPGPEGAAVWVRLEFDNVTGPARTWYLVYRQAVVDRISVYVPRPGGGWTSSHGGLLSAGNSSRLDHRYWVFPVVLPPGPEVPVYVRIENRDAIALPLALQSVESLYRTDRIEQLLFGMLFGILLTVCIYLFFIWRVMRESSQGWLILTELSVAWYIGSQTGFLAELVWPDIPWWNVYSGQVAILAAIVCGISFTRDFLKVEDHLPELGFVLRLMTVGFGALPLLAAVDVGAIAAVMPYASALVATLFLAAAVGALRARVDGAVVYLAALLALMAGALLGSLVEAGLLEATPVTTNLFHIGAGLSAIVFAVGIAGQFKSRQEEKERALRLSNERFSLAADGTSAGLYDWDLTRGTLYFSPRMAELFGPPPRATSSEQPFWSGLLHPGDTERVAAEFRAFLAGQSRTIALDYRIICPDGVLRWVRTTGAAVRDRASNGVVRLAGSTGDITEAKRAESSLRTSENLKSAILNSSLDCIISSDAEGRIIEFNPAAERTFGYSRGEVLGRSLADVIIPRHLRERHREGMRRYRSSGGPRLIGRRFEIEAVRRDGTVFPVELAIIEVTSAGDTVFSAFVRDITERRRAEEALHESQRELAEKTRFLETVLSSIAQGISVVDADLNLRLANDRFLEMYGLPREVTQPGTPVETLLRRRLDRGDFPGSDREALLAEQLAQYRARDEMRREEVRPDGRVIELWRRPMRGGGTVTLFSDITERKRSEEALRASEARFRGITEAHPVPVVITTLDGSRILYASPRTADLLGAPLPVLLQCRAADFYPDQDQRHRFIDRLRANGGVEMMEITLRRWDGTTFPAAVSARIIEYEGYAAAVSGLYDLTFREEAEREIARQREALLQSEKLAALGSLLAGVAHELNNPLSVVVGQSVLMEDMAPDERTRNRATKIHKAADRCARIVKTFLALARRRPPERTDVNFNDIVDASLELVAYALRADGVEVALDLATDLPTLWADGDQLNQVVTNLVVNARQALSERRSGRRLLVATRYEPATSTAVLEVADNGPGVPADIRNRIFEPFFTTKPAGIGTGVGLSICHNIVDAHGGTIAVADTPGGGATLVVRLPVIAREAPQPLPLPVPASIPTGAAAAAALRIMIVDDEPEIALMLAEALEPDGHRIDIAENGMDALERIEAGSRYDVIVSDLRMPELDGPNLHRRVEAKWPDLAGRFVFITGDTLSVSVKGFLSGAALPVLEKPFTATDLRAVIARVRDGTAPTRRDEVAGGLLASVAETD